MKLVEGKDIGAEKSRDITGTPVVRDSRDRNKRDRQISEDNDEEVQREARPAGHGPRRLNPNRTETQLT